MAKKGYRDDSRNSFVGSGRLDRVLVEKIDTTDMALFTIASDLGQTAGEDARKRISKQTVTVDANGGGSADCVRLTLTRYCVDEAGDALASSVTVTIDGTDYTTTTGGKIVHTLDGDDYATAKAMLDAINALPGFKAEIYNALTTHNMDTVHFIDQTQELNIPPVNALAEKLQIVKRDVSGDNIVYLRIGLPTKKDRNPLQLMQIKGSITNITGGQIKLYNDDEDLYKSDGSHLVELESFTPSATANTEHLDDNVLEGQTVGGPVVLRVSATAITGASYSVKYRQQLVG